MKNKRWMIGMVLVLIISVVAGCGGGSGGGDVENNDLSANLSGQPLTPELKAYKAAAQIVMDVLDNVSDGSPVIVPEDVGLKAVSTASCSTSGGIYTCTVNGDSGNCTVTVIPTGDGNGFETSLDCDNFAYTDDDGDAFVVDGGYDVSVLYENLLNSLRVTMTYSTPSGFSVSVNGETFTYGSDFQMVIVYIVTDSSISVTLDITGNVNGQFVNVGYTLNCVDTSADEVQCTQTS